MPDRAARARAAGVLLLLTPVIWGATFPAAKVALRDVSPWTFVAWSRGLGLLAILVVLLIWRPPREAWTRGLVPAGALLGALMTAGYVLQTVGINNTTATNAGFITVLYVVLAPAGAALIGRHTPDRIDVLCLGLALGGPASAGPDRRPLPRPGAGRPRPSLDRGRLASARRSHRPRKRRGVPLPHRRRRRAGRPVPGRPPCARPDGRLGDPDGGDRHP